MVQHWRKHSKSADTPRLTENRDMDGQINRQTDRQTDREMKTVLTCLAFSAS